jgi:hypothetical protein
LAQSGFAAVPVPCNGRVAGKICIKEDEMTLRLGIFSAVILTALLLPAQDVKTDYDHSYDFSQLKTFAVKVGTSWGNPLAEQRAKDAVTQQLIAKGWTQADEATADAIVVIHGATKTEQSLNTFYSGGGYYGWGWGGGPSMATTTVNEVHVGTGVVDIFDAKTKKLVFRGIAQDEVSEKAEKNEKKIEKATEKMFKNFPPKAKAS